MEAWACWAIFAIVTLFIEVATVGFAFMCLSIGAVVASICCAIFGADLSPTWQLGIFSAVTTLSFIIVRPFVMKCFVARSKDRAVASNTDALIGKVAKVTVRIENGEGRVAVGGDDWKAEMASSTEVVEVGDRVIVRGIQGVVLFVELIK